MAEIKMKRRGREGERGRETVTNKEVDLEPKKGNTCELLDLHKSKQDNAIILSISFPMENEKRAAQVGFVPTTLCL